MKRSFSRAYEQFGVREKA